ncbi:MAG: DUF418 domain-containing protein [Flavobacteriaceae bacterium]|nr:DUF418 domain-containing protein [Flavobacteriaceae bacterium]
MNTQTNSFTSHKASERIISLDVMRGIVLFGILLMNINGMGLAGSYSDPTVSGGDTGWNLTTWITTNLSFEGTMRALFSLLFGVGMFIFLDRLEKKGAGIKAANIYFRRLIWLLIFGLIHGYLLLWTGEILYDYALMGFMVFSFRNLSPKKLILTAFLLFSIGALWNYADYKKDVKLVNQVELAESYKVEGKELTKELKEATAKWEEREWKRSPEGIEDFNTNMRKGYLDVLVFLAPENQYTDKYWTYRYDLWDIFSMMLLGIALFKWNILSAEKSYKFYGTMAVIGYLIGLSINYYEILSIIEGDFSFLSFSKSNITYDLGRVPVAIGHIGLIMLFCKLPFLKWLKSSLAAVGKMALTNYVMHSVFAMFIFTGVGFGLFGTFQRYELLYIVFSIWIIQLIISPIWLKYYQFGPLEWIWRNLSYLKKHPFKKNNS